MKFVFFLLLFFCILSCKEKGNQNRSEKNFQNNNSDFYYNNHTISEKTKNNNFILKIMDTIQISKQFEKLNIDAFNQKKVGTEYNEQLDSNINIHIYEAGDNIYYTESHPDSYYSILKVFYSNGNIKKKGLAINHSLCMVGIWYYFDESGKFIKEVDLDANYQFSFEDILKYCRREGIIVEKGLSYPDDIYFPTEITRDDSGGKRIWTITYFNKNGAKTETVNLDGNTGKVISRESTTVTM